MLLLAGPAAVTPSCGRPDMVGRDFGERDKERRGEGGSEEKRGKKENVNQGFLHAALTE